MSGATVSMAVAGLRGRRKSGLLATFAVLLLAAVGMSAGMVVAHLDLWGEAAVLAIVRAILHLACEHGALGLCLSRVGGHSRVTSASRWSCCHYPLARPRQTRRLQSQHVDAADHEHPASAVSSPPTAERVVNGILSGSCWSIGEGPCSGDVVGDHSISLRC